MDNHIPMRIVCCGTWLMQPCMARNVHKILIAYVHVVVRPHVAAADVIICFVTVVYDV